MNDARLPHCCRLTAWANSTSHGLKTLIFIFTGNTALEFMRCAHGLDGNLPMTRTENEGMFEMSLLKRMCLSRIEMQKWQTDFGGRPRKLWSP